MNWYKHIVTFEEKGFLSPKTKTFIEKIYNI